VQRSETFERTSVGHEHGEGLEVPSLTRRSWGGEGLDEILLRLVPDPCDIEEFGEIDAVGGHAMEERREGRALPRRREEYLGPVWLLGSKFYSRQK